MQTHLKKTNMENKTQEIQAVGMSDLTNIAELLTASTNLTKLKPVVTLSSSYIELEAVGSSFRGIFAGYTEINITDKETGETRVLPSARFIIDKQIRVNAGAVLVSECKKCAISVGTPLEVKYSRKEGQIKIYELTLLG